MERKTPLYEAHLQCGGKIVPFAGYLLPVQYEKTGVIAEHNAVRTQVGMFDVSHMGEFLFTGETALSDLQKLLTNDYSDLSPGRVRYSPMCYEDGGVVDDLLVYKLSAENTYFVVVNASNREKDSEWMQAHLSSGTSFEDLSDSIAQIALQGKKAVEILTSLTADSIPVKYYSFTEGMQVAGVSCLVSRTGYTGEDGFELYCAEKDAVVLWNAFLEKGVPPCGLGARDTLRLEAAMPLYGHEMSEEILPTETGLSFFVKTGKEFLGREALLRPVKRDRVGLEITGRGIAREHCDVLKDGRKIGFTTSGTFCPTLKKALAMAILEKPFCGINTEVQVDIRGKLVDAKITALPFYKREKEK